MLVLEPLDAALARGAKIYAEVLGYGVSCDAHHMTAAHPQADGAIRAMSAAMKDSGVGTGDIDYISAHGTGTPTNDRIESLAVRTLFAERATSSSISPDMYRQVQNTTSDLLAALKKNIREYKANDWLSAKKFVESLAYDVRFPAG